jgi:hypothetical protein
MPSKVLHELEKEFGDADEAEAELHQYSVGTKSFDRDRGLKAD